MGPTPSRTIISQVRPLTTPAGPGRYSPAPGRGLPVSSPGSGRGRDSMPFPVKLVKTAKCHRNVMKRPVIVPKSQNGVQKSPLDFLGFTFWPAFSPKELMGHFRPYPRVYCQNDEVSTMCTRVYVREMVGCGTVRYPLARHCRSIPHLTSQLHPQRGILNERVSIRKLGTFGSREAKVVRVAGTQ